MKRKRSEGGNPLLQVHKDILETPRVEPTNYEVIEVHHNIIILQIIV